MRFTDTQIEVLKGTSMRDILAAEGYDTSHTSGGLFFSPFREKERTPSFHIDDAAHRWYDHGAAAESAAGCAGGDVITFVRRLKGLDFTQALEYLCRYNPSVVPSFDVDPISVPRGDDAIVGAPRQGGSVETSVDGIRDVFTDMDLVRYAEKVRCIPRRYLEAACKEVTYRVSVTDTATGEVREYVHTAIGFRNAGGGWALRYVARRGRDKGKRSTGGGFSAIDRGGMNMLAEDLAASCHNVVVFEGFMDYISWLVFARPSARPEDTDVVVLNSVSNLARALPFILLHRNVVAVLDRDAAGDAATARLEKECVAAEPRVRCVDARDAVLRGYKDVNDRLVAESKGSGMPGAGQETGNH